MHFRISLKLEIAIYLEIKNYFESICQKYLGPPLLFPFFLIIYPDMEGFGKKNFLQKH